jgi:hypothetical protein
MFRGLEDEKIEILARENFKGKSPFREKASTKRMTRRILIFVFCQKFPIAAFVLKLHQIILMFVHSLLKNLPK